VIFLIWGIRVRLKTIVEGIFFCPACGGDRNYQLKQGQRWFTIFFIPVIPLGKVGEPFAQCTACKNAYKSSVLETPTSSDLSEHLLGAVREALVSMFRQAPPTLAAMRTAVDVLTMAANRPWSEADVRSDIQTLDVTGLQSRLGHLAGALNEHGKESLLGSVARVAAADGSISPNDRRLLDFVAGSLGMTAAHARGVVDHIGTQHSL
jgi:hypothetical protein